MTFMMRVGEDEENQQQFNHVQINKSKSNQQQQTLPSPPLSLTSSPTPSELSFPLQDNDNESIRTKGIRGTGGDDDELDWDDSIKISQHSRAEKGKGRVIVVLEQEHSSSSNNSGLFVSKNSNGNGNDWESSSTGLLNSNRLNSNVIISLIDSTLNDSDQEDKEEEEEGSEDEDDDEIIQSSLVLNKNYYSQLNSLLPFETNKKRFRSNSPNSIKSRKFSNRKIGSSRNDSENRRVNQTRRGSSATLPSPNLSPASSVYSSSTVLPELSQSPIILSLDRDILTPATLTQTTRPPLASVSKLRTLLGNFKCHAPPLPPLLDSINIPFYLTGYVIPPTSLSPRLIRKNRLTSTSTPTSNLINSSCSRLSPISNSTTSTSTLTFKTTTISAVPSISESPSSPSTSYDLSSSSDSEDSPSLLSLPPTSSSHPAPKLLETSSRHWRDLSPSLDNRAHLNPGDLTDVGGEENRGRRVDYSWGADPRRFRVGDLDRDSDRDGDGDNTKMDREGMIMIKMKRQKGVVRNWKVEGTLERTKSGGEEMEKPLPDPWWEPPDLDEREKWFEGNDRYLTGFEALRLKYEKMGI